MSGVVDIKLGAVKMSDMDAIGNRLAYLLGVHLRGRAVNESVHSGQAVATTTTCGSRLWNVEVDECLWFDACRATVNIGKELPYEGEPLMLKVYIEGLLCWGRQSQPERLNWQRFDNAALCGIAGDAVREYNLCGGGARNGHTPYIRPLPSPVPPRELPLRLQGDLFL